MLAKLPEKIESVCVFCGARPGNDPVFLEIAAEVGKKIAESGLRLVFGAGGLGLMGATAQGALDAGGKVTGIVPDFLKRREIPVPNIDDLLIVDTMHTRKRLMYDRSDAFVILPGGLGTLDELVEVVTWFQLDLHRKPVYLMDTKGYWQPFLDLIDTMAKHGFVDPYAREYFEVVATADELVEKMHLEDLRVAAL